MLRDAELILAAIGRSAGESECYELSKKLNFSLRRLLKRFGLYEANFARIREGECRIREVKRKKLDSMNFFLEKAFSIHNQIIG